MPDPRPLPGLFELPDEVRALLLHGSAGRDHLLRTASAALSHGLKREGAERAGLALTARDIFATAWTQAPLEGETALMLAQVRLPREAALPEALSALLAQYAQAWSPPPATDPYFALSRPSDAPARAEHIARRAVAEPRNLFWKAEAWRLAVVHALWEPALATILHGEWPRTLAPVRLLAQAQLLLARGDAPGALARLRELDGLGVELPGAPSQELAGECLLRLGQGRGAERSWTACLVGAPWRVNTLLKLHDHASGAGRELAPPSGSVAILIYSYNKAAELDATLRSLADSDTGGAPVWVLDNGSTDATPEVVRAWGERLGDRLSAIRLPVNVGAPAARNWLLALPEVLAHDFLVFLDDDVSLPSDWLNRLGAAARLCPEASVWGCRVVDEASPLVAQSVDYAPLAPDLAEGGRKMVLPHLHHGLADLGQFTYLRPCVCVMGCCHMLRTADITRAGGFDIRFSPSQGDDVERDLRVLLAGGHAAYQGHLAVRHKRRSGLAVERSAAEHGNATANAHKLETKHPLEAFLRAHHDGEALLERDLRRKAERISGRGAG